MLFLSALHALPMNVKLMCREDDRGHGRHHNGEPRGGCRRGLATFWASKARPHTIRTNLGFFNQAKKRSGRPVPRLPPGLRPAVNLTLQILPRVQSRKGLASRPQRPNGEREDQTHAHRWGAKGARQWGGCVPPSYPSRGIFPGNRIPQPCGGTGEPRGRGWGRPGGEKWARAPVPVRTPERFHLLL